MSHPVLHIKSLTAHSGNKLICCHITSLNATVQQETITELLSCIENLPGEGNAVINFHYFRNKSIHEIKARSGVSESAVRNRLNYGLHLLRRQLSKKPKNPV